MHFSTSATFQALLLRFGGDPSNVASQRDLSISLINLGDVQLMQGDQGGARISYEQTRKIIRKLATSDSNNADWQRDLFVLHVKFGDLAEREREIGLARKEFAAGLKIAERLTNLDTTNAIWRNDLAGIRSRLESLK